ncbi:hypothetical protein Bbelb_204280 [Branchiostoma belcheri]|nr:hypothetical protein Bbelb_204280 [Branchiostoma belcheri]
MSKPGVKSAISDSPVPWLYSIGNDTGYVITRPSNIWREVLLFLCIFAQFANQANFRAPYDKFSPFPQLPYAGVAKESRKIKEKVVLTRSQWSIAAGRRLVSSHTANNLTSTLKSDTRAEPRCYQVSVRTDDVSDDVVRAVPATRAARSESDVICTFRANIPATTLREQVDSNPEPPGSTAATTLREQVAPCPLASLTSSSPVSSLQILSQQPQLQDHPGNRWIRTTNRQVQQPRPPCVSNFIIASLFPPHQPPLKPAPSAASDKFPFPPASAS